MTRFKDNFSKQSLIYSRYRPGYPVGLFAFLRTLTRDSDLAWDCGTGNGQCALSLARYYKTVYATDPSDAQIQNATAHPNIIYKVEPAEHPGLSDNSVDLVTIAQALHWFKFDKFYAEVKRVLKPNGIIAAWAYGLPSISAEIDPLLRHFHDVVLGEYWLYENRLIDKEYTTIPFPFMELETPGFEMQKAFSFDEFIGLLNTWSAVQSFIKKNGNNPVSELEPVFKERWLVNEVPKMFTWKLILRVGRYC